MPFLELEPVSQINVFPLFRPLGLCTKTDYPGASEAYSDVHLCVISRRTACVCKLKLAAREGWRMAQKAEVVDVTQRNLVSTAADFSESNLAGRKPSPP